MRAAAVEHHVAGGVAGCQAHHTRWLLQRPLDHVARQLGPRPGIVHRATCLLQDSQRPRRLVVDADLLQQVEALLVQALDFGTGEDGLEC